MRCKNVRELLMTDYLDAAVPEKILARLRRHLEECQGCRRLEEELRLLRGSFTGAKRVEPPEEVWSRVRDTITAHATGRSRGMAADFIRKILKGAAFRPAFALAAALLIVTALFYASGSLHRAGRIVDQLSESDLAVYLAIGNGDEAEQGFGTTIEEYFL